jgi:uracil DNA glycosylase
MEYINCEILSEMTLDMMKTSKDYAAISRVWTYMNCALHYPTNVIVIGQSPYESSIVPLLGSAFSQKSSSVDTPTTRIFGLHFDEQEDAREFMGSNRNPLV